MPQGCLELLAKLSEELSEDQLIIHTNYIVTEVVMLYLKVNQLSEPDLRKPDFAIRAYTLPRGNKPQSPCLELIFL